MLLSGCEEAFYDVLLAEEIDGGVSAFVVEDGVEGLEGCGDGGEVDGGDSERMGVGERSEGGEGEVEVGWLVGRGWGGRGRGRGGRGERGG